jgi:hypothetical protein
MVSRNGCNVRPVCACLSLPTTSTRGEWNGDYEAAAEFLGRSYLLSYFEVVL